MTPSSAEAAGAFTYTACMAQHSLIDKPLPRTELPVLPVVITTLMSMDVEGENCFEELMTLARLDPSLAIKVLQQAAAMGTAMGGDTLPKAMMCIGLDEVRRLVTEQSTARIFVPVSQAEKGLWLHFIQVALLSEALVGALPGLGLDTDRAYLAGLLHDVGRLVFYDRVASSPNEIDSTDYYSPESLLLAETQSLGRSHVDIGREAISRWALPDYVSAVIAHHHSPVRELRLENIDFRKFIELIQFADEISVFAMRGYDLDSQDFEDLVTHYLRSRSVYLKDAPLTQDALLDLARKTLEQADEAFLGLKLGKPAH